MQKEAISIENTNHLLTPNNRKSKELSIENQSRSKAIIVIALGVLAVAILLFSNIFSFSESRADINVGFSGFYLFTMLLTGNYTLNYDMGGGTFEIIVPPTIVIVFCILAILFIALIVVNFIFSFVKKRDYRLLAIGYISIAVLYFATYIVFISSTAITAIDRLGTQKPLYQVFDINIIVLFVFIIAVLMSALQGFLKLQTMKKVRNFLFIYLLLLIPTICMIVFNFYPIFMQTIISFKDYKLSQGVWGSSWVGFKYFMQIFTDKEIVGVIGNSLYLAFIRLVFTTLPPLILSLMLYDMAFSKMRKIYQTIFYIPHFFSWIIIYGVFYAFFSPTGAVNQIIALITGTNANPADFLTNQKFIIPILMISLVWKEVGWGTILYLAALSNVDQTLYEAASIDGAGPLTKLFKITLPSIMGVVIFLLIMAIGGIMQNGLEQILLFANLAVRDKVYTIELWVYERGLNGLNYGLGSAVGFFQSFIGLILVLGCNWLSNKTVQRGLW